MRLLLTVFFILFGDFAIAEDSLPVSIVGCLTGYNKFVEEKGGDPLEIRDFHSSVSNRCVVSVVMMQQALRLGGYMKPLRIVQAPSHYRAKKMAIDGEVALTGNEIWKEFFDDQVLMTSAVVRKGEFLKLICVRADNQELLNIKTLDELKDKIAVTGNDWTVDIKTLKNMGIENVYRVSKYDSQLKMIKAGRVDFSIFELTELKRKNSGLFSGIVPVPGIMVGLDSSRHYMVSKSHPEGAAVHAALDRGLKILREQGRIKKAMLDCGFLNPIVADWQVIYPNDGG